MNNEYENSLYAAFAAYLASVHHEGQVDKAGNPYYHHVAAVAKMCSDHGYLAEAAGYLHDIVEDTEVTLDQLRDHGFPEVVVSAVDAVTKRPGEPYLDAVRRAARDPLGRVVKLADNRHNSDEDRLALLPPEKRDRLRKKYAQARKILEEYDGGRADHSK